ncbi:MAG: tryptophan synthase subunit alpha [Endozoicomonas sp. (ex Botrylloides leachii)]|nr:tryptophan synthase subunit alpha [Endozoicomonas sp. (ex Botrylloides leachii)]
MRIKRCFQQLQAKQKKALIPYITAGHPKPAMTVELMHQLVHSGADIIELGFPFSDPMADGPIIARAHQHALSQGVTLNDVFSMVMAFREQDNTTPVVLMGYLNPIESMGYEKFARCAHKAGVDGVLVVDLPPEYAAPLADRLSYMNIDMINLIAPTTSVARIHKICEVATGYLYCVALKGVTGSATLNIKDVEKRVAQIKALSTLPVGVGFGIRDGHSAAAISKVADGIVVGSVLVSALAEASESNTSLSHAVSKSLADMRTAMDRNSE